MLKLNYRTSLKLSRQRCNGMAMFLTSLKVSEELLGRIIVFSTKRHISRSEAIRLAMEYALKNRKVLRLNEQLAPRGDCDIAISLKIPRELMDAYDRISEMYKISRSELIRRALEAYLPPNDAPKARVEKIRL